jgi:hypothetical protein
MPLKLGALEVVLTGLIQVLEAATRHLEELFEGNTIRKMLIGDLPLATINVFCALLLLLVEHQNSIHYQ